MKVLFLVQKEQRAILDRLYDGIAAHCECDTRWLSSEEQADLRGYFRKHVDVSRYDRILFFLRFKKEMRQVRFIRSVPNLVILEHDAYQNYIPCKYTGKFSAHYRRLPWARVISSGHTVSERLRQEGFDAVFVPKGYDQTLLHDLGLARDIELGFVGSTGSVAYSGRKALLDELGGVENLLVTKTKSGEEYLRTLNRIRFFVSADVGMGEYMIKNSRRWPAVAYCWPTTRASGKTRPWVSGTWRISCCIARWRTSRKSSRSCASIRLSPSGSREAARRWPSNDSASPLSVRVSSRPCGPRCASRSVPDGWRRPGDVFLPESSSRKELGLQACLLLFSLFFRAGGRCRTDEDRRIAHACLAL